MTQAVLDVKANNFISGEGLDTKVKWDNLARFERQCRHSGSCGIQVYEDVENNVWQELLERKVLSYSSEGAFALVGEGIIVGPRLSHFPMPLYFNWRKDALNYAQAFLKSPNHHPVHLLQGVEERVNR